MLNGYKNIIVIELRWKGGFYIRCLIMKHSIWYSASKVLFIVKMI